MSVPRRRVSPIGVPRAGSIPVKGRFSTVKEQCLKNETFDATKYLTVDSCS